MRQSRTRLTLAGLAASVALAAGSFGAISAQGQAGAQGQGQGRGGAGQGQGQGQGQRGGGQGGAQGGGRAGQARDATPQPQTLGTGSIAGYVTLAGSTTPVRRARVTLTGAEVRPGRSAQTDDKGYYSIQNLPAGSFTVTVSKPGYVNMRYGAKKPGRPGTAIQLADGQKIDRASIALPKGAVITGVVIDEYGEPSPRTQVHVMRFVTSTGEKTLESTDQSTTDDRGMYRVWGLVPGDYLVSAVPRNSTVGDTALAAAADALLQQAQAMGLGGGGGGRGGAGGAVAPVIAGGPGGRGGRGQQIIDEILRQQQASGTEPQQQVAYAPVYYPGTTSSVSASTVTLGSAEERSGVDFQLQLVPTATINGTVSSSEGTLPQGIQVSLVPQTAGPTVPGVGSMSSRVDQSGRFTFSNVPPGQYTVMARAMIRPTAPAANPNDPQAQAALGARGGRGGQGGPGGPGGRGGPSQILWAASDVTVSGQALPDISLNLQAGMTISGRVTFESSTLAPPTDLTRVRIALSTRGQQTLDMGGLPPAQIDTNGNFKLIGVAPGHYVISANAPVGDLSAAGGAGGGRGGGGRGAGALGGGQGGGSWTLKSAVVNGRDTLDFPLEIHPNEEIGGAMVTFTDRTQEVSGTLQDAAGRPTPDFTIIVFASDKQFWTPQSRRIASARPDTSGKFTVRGLPPGDYRVTAVTEAAPGEWFDPVFLQQLIGGSVPFTLAPGEKHTQDLRVSGGGH